MAGQRSAEKTLAKPTSKKAVKKQPPKVTDSASAAAPTIVKSIPIEDIAPHPQNTRTFAKKDKDDPELVDLAASIKSVGILQPILVRAAGSGFQLLAGERRLRAARLAGLSVIDAIVRDVDDKGALEVLIMENLQRKNLHPLEEARGVRALMDGADWSVQDVADRLGKSLNWVAQRARLVLLSDTWQKAIFDSENPVSRWPIGHLILVAKLEPSAQDALAEHGQFMERWANVPDRTAIAHAVGDSLHTLSLALWNKADSSLYPEAGSCVDCRKRSSCHPGLFEDEDPKEPAKNERCMDALCWSEKIRRFLALRQAALRAKHPDLVLVHRDTQARRTQDGALDPWSFQCAKKGEPDARPALVVDGKGAGSLLWIVSYRDTASGRCSRPKDADGKSIPSSLAERRAALDKRRRVRAVSFIIDAIKSLRPFPKPSHVLDPMLHLLLPLAAVFGTNYKEDSSQFARNRRYDDGAGESPSGASESTEGGKDNDHEQQAEGDAPRRPGGNPQAPWTDLFASLVNDPNACAQSLWSQIRPVLIHRLTYQGTGTNVADLWADAECCCGALGINSEAAYAAAVKAIPEPKAWARLQEDGNPAQGPLSKMDGSDQETATEYDAEPHSDLS